MRLTHQAQLQGCYIQGMVDDMSAWNSPSYSSMTWCRPVFQHGVLAGLQYRQRGGLGVWGNMVLAQLNTSSLVWLACPVLLESALPRNHTLCLEHCLCCLPSCTELITPAASGRSLLACL